MIYTNAHKRLLKKTIRLIIWHWNQDVRRSDLGRYNLGALKPYTQVGNTLLLRESRGSRDRV